MQNPGTNYNTWPPVSPAPSPVQGPEVPNVTAPGGPITGQSEGVYAPENAPSASEKDPNYMWSTPTEVSWEGS